MSLTYQPFAATPAIDKLAAAIGSAGSPGGFGSKGLGFWLITKALRTRGPARLALLAAGGFLCYRAYKKNKTAAPRR